MAHDFTMPKLGLTMTDGTIREWLVADGSLVQVGDPVLIIETDKVETEVEAREAGILTISGQVGENYECGAVIGQLLGDGETAPVQSVSTAEAPADPQADIATPDAATAVPAPAAATEVVTPSPMPSQVPAAASNVAVRGEYDRILASPMARAAAREGGIDLAAISGTGPNGRIIADDVAAFAAVAADADAAVVAVPATSGSTDVAVRGEHDRVLASPMARAAARDADVDLAAVSGTGPNGRIVADDVAAFAAEATAAPTPAPAAAPATTQAVTAPATAPPPAPVSAAAATPSGSAAVSATGGARMLAELLGVDLRMVPATIGARVTREDVATWVRQQLAEDIPAPAESEPTEAASLPTPLLQEPTAMVPLRGMRGVIAERMHASLTEMAQLTLSVDADMSAVQAQRQLLKEAGGSAPGYTAWVIAAASRALTDHPYVNSQVTPEGVAHLPDIHVGVAVALDDGLIVPVIDNANMRAVDEIHEMVADLAGRARDRKLTLDELQGGTFSVTALGMYGVDMFTPVINPPNSAILGVGRLRTDTMWAGGVPSPKTVMTLSLTWDHRAFDGAPAAEFAQSIVRYLENPAQLTE